MVVYQMADQPQYLTTLVTMARQYVSVLNIAKLLQIDSLNCLSFFQGDLCKKLYYSDLACTFQMAGLDTVVVFVMRTDYNTAHVVIV